MWFCEGFALLAVQLRFPVSLSTTYVWNGLFDTAMGDGADYFMACHDDTEFYPLSGKYWTDVLVGKFLYPFCTI